MNYLVDTNIFLEILLNQAGRKRCEPRYFSLGGAPVCDRLFALATPKAGRRPALHSVEK